MPAPESLTYNSLVTDIESYSERSDEEFLLKIPRFVMLAEQRLAMEAKGAEFKLEVGNSVYVKPARWRQTKSMLYVTSDNETVFLKPRNYGYCRAFGTNEPTGLPKYYSDIDYTHWYLAVRPNAAFNAEVTYYERPDSLSEANQTNWTTRNAPQLLLYASLLEAQPYLKNTANLAMWQAQYAEMVASVLKEESNFDSDETEAK